MKALLSIKPEFASAIFDGAKRYEFRRTIFRAPVKVVVVYVSSPVCHVAGEFDVKTIIYDSVRSLWQRTRDEAGINRTAFFRYFEGRAYGYGVEIGAVRLYERPLDLREHFGVNPPQSFVYLT